MHQFSIKAVERLSGIKAHTIRVWEQRYGILKPDRKESNHRLYSTEDLKLILRIVFLYNNGFKLKKIASMDENEMNGFIHSQNTPEALQDVLMIELIEAVMDFNEEKFDEKLKGAIHQFGFESAMIRLAFPLLNKLGLLWMTNQVVPGQEHFASNIISRKIISAIDSIRHYPVQNPGRVMLFTPEGEFHEIGLLYMNFLLRSHGFNTTYLGVNVSSEVLNAFYLRYHPSHFYIHLTSNLQEKKVEQFCNQLKLQFPETKLILTGPVIKRMTEQIPDVVFLNSEKDLLHFSKDIFYS